MKKILLSLATVTAFATGVLAPTASSALESGAAYGGSVGALTMETRALATTPDEVRAQGGFATAGTVRWFPIPAAPKLSAASF